LGGNDKIMQDGKLLFVKIKNVEEFGIAETRMKKIFIVF